MQPGELSEAERYYGGYVINDMRLLNPHSLFAHCRRAAGSGPGIHCTAYLCFERVLCAFFGEKGALEFLLELLTGRVDIDFYERIQGSPAYWKSEFQFKSFLLQSGFVT